MKRPWIGLLILVAGIAVFLYWKNSDTSLPSAASSFNSDEEQVANAHWDDQEALHSSSTQATQDTVTESASPAATAPSQSTGSNRPGELAQLYGRNMPTQVSQPKGSTPMDVPADQLFSHPALAGETWKLWRGVAAYPQTQELNRRPVASVNGFNIYPQEQSDLANFNTYSKPVVYDADTMTAGVLSGTFILELVDGVSPSDIHFATDIEVVSHFDELGLIFVRPRDPSFNIQRIYAGLASDPSFKSVRMEVLGRNYEKF